ncbi:peptidylprolyl isomerase [Methanoregula formicica]|uniref:peptidylprolyl isomerase n=1 Tax=Methanoregula formicica (strain DSM 22288 / NBRC 105244 / SMSP) TaxID=593750 RepID=L0HGE9_METFS|nr:peptidylprolyl isomerase [Methanoregula formicica]AGB03812.1 peptidyl-prolyl cis-trans isomerase (rotamase) - cyclophilin family [Methanoregula formicica SMSP]
MLSFRTLSVIGLFLLALVLSAGCTQSAPVVIPESTPSGTPVPVVTTATATPTPGETVSPAVTLVAGKKVRLETSMGDIVIALSPEKPITAGNFETLVEKGFYNGVIFHRVIDGFMIQGGDPTGTGRGGPGYLIDDEFTGTNKNNRGTVAMANTGQPNTGGSQFFINTVDNNYLDTKHPVFGTVTEGMDVVDAITKVETNGYPYYRPLQNVTIIRATMI